MRYFRYWVKESFQIQVNGNLKDISILSGSNESKEDARKGARRFRIHVSEVGYN
jgi:hypothetical protein